MLSISESCNSDNSVDDNPFFDDYDEDEGPDMLGGFMEWNMSMDFAGVATVTKSAVQERSAADDEDMDPTVTTMNKMAVSGAVCWRW
ncbi:hypothetical protein Tco_0787304 [Tanacetum coccineum]